MQGSSTCRQAGCVSFSVPLTANTAFSFHGQRQLGSFGFSYFHRKRGILSEEAIVSGFVFALA